MFAGEAAVSAAIRMEFTRRGGKFLRLEFVDKGSKVYAKV
jgi:hypothetical protein